MSLPDDDIDEHAEVERVEEFGRVSNPRIIVTLFV